MYTQDERIINEQNKIWESWIDKKFYDDDDEIWRVITKFVPSNRIYNFIAERIEIGSETSKQPDIGDRIDECFSLMLGIRRKALTIKFQDKFELVGRSELNFAKAEFVSATWRVRWNNLDNPIANKKVTNITLVD